MNSCLKMPISLKNGLVLGTTDFHLSGCLTNLFELGFRVSDSMNDTLSRNTLRYGVLGLN